MAPPLDRLTTQGYDLQFGTNVLGKSINVTFSMRGLLVVVAQAIFILQSFSYQPSLPQPKTAPMVNLVS